jgi:hypothetical protein
MWSKPCDQASSCGVDLSDFREGYDARAANAAILSDDVASISLARKSPTPFLVQNVTYSPIDPRGRLSGTNVQPIDVHRTSLAGQIRYKCILAHQNTQCVIGVVEFSH